MTAPLGIVAGLMTLSIEAQPVDATESEKMATVQALEVRALKGEADAQFSLATAHDSGYGVPLDHKKAAHWYQKAAMQGHAYAQFNLGVLYEDGLGVGKNPNKAQFWYEKAVKTGNHEAQGNLGRLLAQQSRYAEALPWFSKAAAGGNIEANYNLGLMHWHGLGTAVDTGKAKALFKAISHQYPPAADALASINQ